MALVEFGMSQSHDGMNSNERREPKAPADSSFEGQMLALMPLLRRYSRSLSRSDSDGEDLLQDCVEHALSKKQQWRGSQMKAWAYAIMTNISRNRYRAEKRHPSENIDACENEMVTEPASDTLENKRLHDALAQLNPDLRAVLMLVTVEGYTYQEVANLMNIPLGTVMSRLSRARETVRIHLSEDNIIPLRRPK
jgi:RNA polymerase sigma-70 factor (ECF subfamily)